MMSAAGQEEARNGNPPRGTKTGGERKQQEAHCTRKKRKEREGETLELGQLFDDLEVLSGRDSVGRIALCCVLFARVSESEHHKSKERVAGRQRRRQGR